MGSIRGYAGLGPQHLGWWKLGASVMSTDRGSVLHEHQF